jgi:hypothetical protein
MEVQFTPEQELRLAQLAATVGTDPAHLVRDAALRLLDDRALLLADAPELPVLHLGAMKSLHRRDIYDDVC